MLLLMIRKIIFLVARSELLRRLHNSLLQYCSLQLGMLMDVGTTQLGFLRIHQDLLHVDGLHLHRVILAVTAPHIALLLAGQ